MLHILDVEKETFWNDAFLKVGCVLQDEMVVVTGLAGDMNGHIVNNNLGCNGI